MKNIDIIVGFELEINKLDDIDKPVTDDSLYWLNQAIYKFVKTRFNRDFVHYTGYEQTAKRTEDLINLYSIYDTFVKKPQIELLNSNNTKSINKPGESQIVQPSIEQEQYDTKYITYPDDFMYPLSETVIITNNNGKNPYSTSVFECTNDSFSYRITNSLSDFNYKHKKARPLRVRTKDGCVLYTDKNYIVDSYRLTYIRKPKKLTLDNPNDSYDEFQDSVLHEIIKIAAQMYVENKKDIERYKTILNEVQLQE